MSLSYICPTCGKAHAGPSFCFGAEFPDYYFAVPPEQRENRIEATNDWCVVDNSHFFIRGRIEIPILGHDEPFCWNAWSSLSEENFIRSQELWSQLGREEEPPYFGWLQTIIPGYPNTLNIKALVHTRPVGTIPYIEIIEEDHLLLQEQLTGITLERALAIVSNIFH